MKRVVTTQEFFKQNHYHLEKNMEEATELKQTDPEFLPAQYHLTAARLQELEKEYDPKNIPVAKVKGDDGYREVHDKSMAIVKVRTNIEKVRKGLTADAVAWQKKVNGEARRLTKIIEEMESPWRMLKNDLDEAEAKKAEEARNAERKRMEEIEDRITDIKSLTEGLLAADSDQIKARLDEALTTVITESLFADYTEAATITLNTVTDTLRKAHQERVDFDQQQADMERQKREMAEQQEKLDAQQREIDEQKATQEAAEQAEREAKEKAAHEAQEEEKRLKREQEAAEAAEREAVELRARLPEDARVRIYRDELLAVEVPVIEDPALSVILNQAVISLSNLAGYITHNTQDPIEESE